MSFNNTGVIFLEDGDFDGNKLKNVASGKWFIIIQATYCGWCTKAKPEFIKAKEMAGDDVKFATIHVDSEHPKTAALAKDIETIFGTKVEGIPAFFSYDAKTHKSKKFSGNNKATDFVEFINNS